MHVFFQGKGLGLQSPSWNEHIVWIQDSRNSRSLIWAIWIPASREAGKGVTQGRRGGIWFQLCSSLIQEMLRVRRQHTSYAIPVTLQLQHFQGTFCHEISIVGQILPRISTQKAPHAVVGNSSVQSCHLCTSQDLKYEKSIQSVQKKCLKIDNNATHELFTWEGKLINIRPYILFHPCCHCSITGLHI